MFFIPIHNIAVSEGLGRGDRIEDNIFVTNQKDVIQSKLPARLAVAMGGMEQWALLECPLVAYGEIFGAEQPDQDAVDNALLVQLVKLKHFLLMLWLIKDNAAGVENGFMEEGKWISVRVWPGVCTTASGCDDKVTFSRQELKKARSLYQCAYPLPSALDPKVAYKTEIVAPDLTRMSRAMYFLSAARATHQLSVKIANYCSAFEALLLSEPAELAYRLAERVAWLLGETSTERKDLFERMKKAYTIRSKAVHGSYVSANKLKTDLQEGVLVCDDVLRRLFRLIGRNERLTEFIRERKGRPEEFEDFMQRVTLGEPLPDDETSRSGRRLINLADEE